MIVYTEGHDPDSYLTTVRANATADYIIRCLSGKYEVGKVDWSTIHNDRTITMYDNQYEAILRATTKKTDLAIKRALKKIESEIEEKETIVMVNQEDTSDSYGMTVRGYYSRERKAHEVVRLLRLFRPKTATIGQSENYRNNSNQILYDFMSENTAQGLKPRGFAYSVPVVGTVVLKLGFGFHNNNKYSDSNEFLYLKI